MRRGSLTLTRRFAVVSLVAVLSIGLALSAAVSRIVQHQAEAEAVRAAELLTSFVEVQLAPTAFTTGVTPAQRQALDRSARNADGGAGLLAVRLWAPDGTVRYDSQRDFEGRRFPLTGHLAGALRGATGAEVEAAGDDQPSNAGEVLEVYTPVHLTGGRVAGALEVYLSFDASRARASQASRQIGLVLLAGLGLLWALMWQLSRRVAGELRSYADQQKHLALHDALTGLPNRRMLLSATEHALEGDGAALLLLDLDRFKEINDSLGHHIGDQLLCEIGRRLAEVVPADSVVARLGGDEFAVLAPHLTDTDQALLLGSRVLQAFEAPFPVGELLLQVEPSIGVAVAPSDAADAASLLQRADVAMYDAKVTHASVAAYRPESDVHTPDRLQLLADLRAALNGGTGLRLAYQPISSVDTGRVLGVEALLRWDHPTRGLVAPADFVGAAEHTGLIRPLTQWVLDEALAQCRRWLDEGLRLSVAVNLSARNLSERDLPTTVGAALVRHGVPAELLVLEITESAVIDDPEEAEQLVGRLVALGLTMSLDDFGTGYSSMATLMRLPLRSLKIDRSFVSGLDQPQADGSDSVGTVITRTTIAMAHQLGLSVVAEGVETAAQLARLVELGCDAAQGFLLARPSSAATVTAYVDSAATLG